MNLIASQANLQYPNIQVQKKPEIARIRALAHSPISCLEQSLIIDATLLEQSLIIGATLVCLNIPALIQSLILLLPPVTSKVFIRVHHQSWSGR